MITGVHIILYSSEAQRVRELLRDILETRSVDAGGAWMIFAMPPAEVAVHPHDGPGYHEMYLMCDDLPATIRQLRRKGVEMEGEPTDHGWGIVTSIRLPGGDRLWLYEPKHPTALAAG